MHGPLDRLFRDLHRGAHPGERFDAVYGLRDVEGRDLPDDDWLERDWDREQSVWGTIAGLLGVSFQGVIGYFPLGFTLFVAPLAVILCVYGVWLVMFRVAIRQRAQHPYLVFAVPFTCVAAWAVVMWFGWSQLGWPPLRMPGLT